MVDLQVIHDALASTLVAQVDSFRKSESLLAELETQPEFVLGLLQLVLREDVDMGIRRAAAVFLKNKISRSWFARAPNGLSDSDKHAFKQQLVPAIVQAPPSLRDFLLVCLSLILSSGPLNENWPELLPGVVQLLTGSQSPPAMAAAMAILKHICKYYRWNTSAIAKQITPLMAEVYPLILTIAEQSLQYLIEGKYSPDFYQLIYEMLKIYKLSTSRFMPEIMREESYAKRTVSLFLQVFMLPLSDSVLSVQPPSERTSLIPVKCTKWAAANISRTHHSYLTKISRQISENAAHMAPFRKMYLSQFTPEITNVYIQQLQKWSQGSWWLSDATLYNVVYYLESIVDIKAVYAASIEPQFDGLLSQVLFPLLCPSEDDLDLFEDDPAEFVQKQVDITEMITSPSNAASEFISKAIRKKKSTLVLVVQFLQRCAQGLTGGSKQVRERAGMHSLLRTLAPAFLRSPELRSQLESFLVTYIVPDLQSDQPYLRSQVCRTIEKFAELKFQSRQTLQTIFQGVLVCFFAHGQLPVQVFATIALNELCLNDSNEDARAALGMNITDIISNLLDILHRIDFEPLLSVLDSLVELYPTQITPFAVDLAVQLCRQFLSLASDFSEQISLADGTSTGEAELLIASDEKVSAGLGILNSLANLQSSMHHQPELIEKLGDTISLVFEAVYQNRIVDFYPDCMSLHENNLFSLKSVPEQQWKYFGMLLDVIRSSQYDYLEDATPVLENYILYGGEGLAASPERLEGFVSLLIYLYGPRQDIDAALIDDKAAQFTEAKSRSQLMDLAVKLLESGPLQNGPMFSLIPQMLNAVTLRIMEDQKLKVVVPPRYNVSIISLVLSAIFNNPSLTLQMLQQEGTAQSFFDMWFQTLPEFTRVDDYKLCELAILSLLSLDVADYPALQSSLSNLLETLAHSLEAIPGALARKADLIKSEQSGEFNEHDDDDEDYGFDDDDDDDDDDGDLDQYSESLTTLGGAGDGEFVYEQPGIHHSQSNNDSEQSRWAEAAVSISSMGFIADDFDEDIYTISPLDNIDPYAVLKTVLTNLRTIHPDFYQSLMGLLSEKNKAIVQECFERGTVPVSLKANTD